MISDPTASASTFRSSVNVCAAEHGDGTPWICIEFDADAFPTIRSSGFAGFDLKPGTTLAQAKEVAKQINRVASGFSLTIFHQRPPADIQ